MFPSISRRLLVEARAPETTVAVDCKQLGLFTSTHYFRWSAGVLAGEVTIETADDVAYTGEWVPIKVVTFAGLSPRQDMVTIDGAYAALRHRVTGAPSGGSVTTKILGTGQ